MFAVDTKISNKKIFEVLNLTNDIFFMWLSTDTTKILSILVDRAKKSNNDSDIIVEILCVCSAMKGIIGTTKFRMTKYVEKKLPDYVTLQTLEDFALEYLPRETVDILWELVNPIKERFDYIQSSKKDGEYLPASSVFYLAVMDLVGEFDIKKAISDKEVTGVYLREWHSIVRTNVLIKRDIYKNLRSIFLHSEFGGERLQGVVLIPELGIKHLFNNADGEEFEIYKKEYVDTVYYSVNTLKYIVNHQMKTATPTTLLFDEGSIVIE